MWQITLFLLEMYWKAKISVFEYDWLKFINILWAYCGQCASDWVSVEISVPTFGIFYLFYSLYLWCNIYIHQPDTTLNWEATQIVLSITVQFVWCCPGNSFVIEKLEKYLQRGLQTSILQKVYRGWLRIWISVAVMWALTLMQREFGSIFCEVWGLIWGNQRGTKWSWFTIFEQWDKMKFSFYCDIICTESKVSYKRLRNQFFKITSLEVTDENCSSEEDTRSFLEMTSGIIKILSNSKYAALKLTELWLNLLLKNIAKWVQTIHHWKLWLSWCKKRHRNMNLFNSNLQSLILT